jgi:hypothetical protein
MAWYPKLEGPALDAYRRMVASLKEKAMRELNLGPDDIVIRELRPEDIGASSADFYTGVQATTWTKIIDSQTIADNRFIGINGVMMQDTASTNVLGVQVEPPFSQIKIERKGTVARYWVVKPVWAFESRVGYCDDPVTVDQNTTLTVSVWARTASSLKGFTLLGAVAEKRGILISP